MNEDDFVIDERIFHTEEENENDINPVNHNLLHSVTDHQTNGAKHHQTKLVDTKMILSPLFS